MREYRARIKADKRLHEAVLKKRREKRMAQYKAKTDTELSTREHRYKLQQWQDRWKERQALRIAGHAGTADTADPLQLRMLAYYWFCFFVMLSIKPCPVCLQIVNVI